MTNQNNTFLTAKLFDNIKKDKANFFIIILLFVLPFFIIRIFFYNILHISFSRYLFYVYGIASFWGYTLLFSLLTSHFILNKGNKRPLMSDIVSFTVFNFKKIIIPSALISLVLMIALKAFPYIGIFFIIPLSFIPIISLIKNTDIPNTFGQTSSLLKNEKMKPLLPTYIFSAVILFAFKWFLGFVLFFSIKFIPISIGFIIVGILKSIIYLLVIGFIFSLAMNLYYSSLSKEEKYDNEELNTLIKGKKRIQRKEKRDKTSPGRDRFNEDENNRFKDKNYNRFDDSDNKISF